MVTESAMYHKIGFTLIEMIIVVSILSIISILAVPTFIQMINDRRIDSAVQDISFYISEARNQAIISHQMTVLCLDTSLNREACSNYLMSASNKNERTFMVGLPKGIQINDKQPLYFFANGTLKEGVRKITLTYHGKMHCVAIGVLGNHSHSVGECE